MCNLFIRFLAVSFLVVMGANFSVHSASATACKPNAEAANVEANILPIESFLEVQETARELAEVHGTENVLVVFDIDNTLMAARTQLGGDQWFGWQSCLQKNYPDNPLNAVPDSPNRFDDLLLAQRLLFAIGSMRVTHGDAQDVVSFLRREEIPAMILTSRGPKTRDVTRRELENNNLKFWDGFKFRDEKLPEQTGSYHPLNCDVLPAHGLAPEEGETFSLCSSGKPRNVSFDDGMYLTAGQHKGAMLRALLAETNQWFSAVIFVDDHMHHLNGMYAAFKDHLAPENLRLFHFIGEKGHVEEFHTSAEVREKADEDWREIATTACRLMGTWCEIDEAGSTHDERADADVGVSIMSFNVENLFDNEDDPNNEGDATYLPLSEKGTPEHEAICAAISSDGFRRLCRTLDWRDEVLATKLEHVGEVIATFNAGVGPDILILQEVENKAVVERLRDVHLTGSDYITLETFDAAQGRGIDVAILSRFELAAGLTVVAHPVDLSNLTGIDCSTPRDILEVPLTLYSGDILTVFGVHFPSPRNPKVCRDEVMRQLNSLQKNLPAGRMSIVGGDFNITCRAEEQVTLDEIATQQWIIAQEPGVGCAAPGSSFFFDRDAAPGERITWSFLDIIMGSQNLAVGFENGPAWFLNLGSYRTHVATKQQINVSSRGQIKPQRFAPADLSGVSDHWPVVMELLPR